MTLSPLLTAPAEIQIHVVAALVSLLLGPVVIYRRRRDRMHKVLGYVWVSSMATLALSALIIPSFAGPFHFGILHGFAFLTLWTLFFGIRYAIQRNLVAHEAAFRSLYWNGLLIAGMFNFLPGRRINRSLFGEYSELGFVVIGIGAALLIWRATRGWRSQTARA